MAGFVELLQCVLCCEEEDIYEYRQAQRDLGDGGGLLDRIRDAFGFLPTHHHRRRGRESESETSEPLLWNTRRPSSPKFTRPSSSSSPGHVVVHDPMTRDPVRPKTEPNVTRTSVGSTQSSHVTSPFKAAPSASPKPSPSVSKPSTATSSDPIVSPAKLAAISAYLDQYASRSSQSSNEPSLSRLVHPSLSKTSSPTPSPFKAVPSASPKPSPSVSKPTTTTSRDPFVSETKPPISAHLNPNVAKPHRPSNEPSSSQSPSSKTTSASPEAQEHSAKQYKPVLRAVSSASPNQPKETVYVQKDTSPIYNIPEDIKDLIERDIVPGVLKKPLSPSTYRDYFAALLYAEDFYIEKWTDFILKDVNLELHQLTVHKNVWDNDFSREKDNVTFVKFKMESIPERRPFLLSRDFVYAEPLGKRGTQKFKGLVYRVEKWSVVLVEFGDDFHSQHHSSSRYSISFSFNRVCLKRAHQAVEAATDPSFRSFLFPECEFRHDFSALPSLDFSNDVLYSDQRSAIRQILALKGSAPFLMEGPLCTRGLGLSRAGVVVREAVSQAYRRSKYPRILLAAPTNKTCDVLMRSLKKDIPDSEIFRANAAFREYDGVPDDILPSCVYKKRRECFACPPLHELRRFKVICSTFVSSFRLHNEGINAGHFSHIFLVDASSTSEPEAMIVLANLANEDTTVIVTGQQGNRSGWVRSPIARGNGLRISYFERLKELTPYNKLAPPFVARLDPEPESYETNSFLSY
ncbi:probable RNA helicase SDE3 [Eucalyptus grandis]|uniref:probable RNA helicase SDE3 n=1 Tax=Eucalyptus grandis TaxID=71139 RepID=UPI000527AF9D|nr:probable RNA helicase SDE3 [Eucalyptus grandis]